MKQIHKFIIASSIITLGVVSIMVGIYGRKNPAPSNFTVKVMSHNGEHWFYEVYHGDRIIIRQDHIPVVGGSSTFSNEEDAKKTGDIVAQKLNKGLSPSLTFEELKSIGIMIE